MNHQSIADSRPGGAWLEISTERRNPATVDLDTRSTTAILEAMNNEDAVVPGAVRAVLPPLSQLVDRAVEAVQGGRRVHYFGAGTSGRLGVLDAAELLPTFNLEEGVVVAHHAGGDAALVRALENVEDSWESGASDAADVAPGDVCVGIAASGRTPYVGGALETARRRGASTALITCAREPELGSLADFVLIADTGAEILAGSTRLKAGSAQKLILNGFSTALMIRLGKTWSNLMVSMVATNEKLRARTVRILMEATGQEEDLCRSSLELSDGDLRVALLCMFNDVSPEDARAALASTRGSVRAATEFLNTQGSNSTTTA
ncbi:N-acetylmuramic acid 6-phosphate etherase [Arthrobacter zhaoguopingii]|uniref:N-acetylmuramic acid 6-phosphate etherase n=1 Tax=Arthrobacter zhaoguopingii TaxID=2681491 RepID=UPI002484B5A2|nr:N-acetylmuramic acid 6-phosphate etherase [Arthrobacter zhaoguopingii]